MTLCEQTFRKMGWEWKETTVKNAETYQAKFPIINAWAWVKEGWEDVEVCYINWKFDPPSPAAPPSIDEQWEVCAKYLVPFMKERKWNYEITSWDDNFVWTHKTQLRVEETIINHNHAEVACKAFMEADLCS